MRSKAAAEVGSSSKIRNMLSSAQIDPGDNIAKLQRKKAKLRARGNLKRESRTEQLLKRQRKSTLYILGEPL